MSVRITGRIGVAYIDSNNGELEYGEYWDQANAETMAVALERLARELRERVPGPERPSKHSPARKQARFAD